MHDFVLKLVPYTFGAAATVVVHRRILEIEGPREILLSHD